MNFFERAQSKEQKRTLTTKEYLRELHTWITRAGKAAVVAALLESSVHDAKAQTMTPLSPDELESRIELFTLPDDVSPDMLRRYFGDEEKTDTVFVSKHDASTGDEYVRYEYAYTWSPDSLGDTLAYKKIFPSWEDPAVNDTIVNTIHLEPDNRVHMTTVYEGVTATVVDYDSTGVLVRLWNAGEVLYILDREHKEEFGAPIRADAVASHLVQELGNVMHGEHIQKSVAKKEKKKEDKKKGK